MCFCDLVILFASMKWLLSDVGYPVSPTPTCHVVVVLDVDLLESSWGGTEKQSFDPDGRLDVQ